MPHFQRLLRPYETLMLIFSLLTAASLSHSAGRYSQVRSLPSCLPHRFLKILTAVKPPRTWPRLAGYLSLHVPIFQPEYTVPPSLVPPRLLPRLSLPHALTFYPPFKSNLPAPISTTSPPPAIPPHPLLLLLSDCLGRRRAVVSSFFVLPAFI